MAGPHRASDCSAPQGNFVSSVKTPYQLLLRLKATLYIIIKTPPYIGNFKSFLEVIDSPDSSASDRPKHQAMPPKKQHSNSRTPAQPPPNTPPDWPAFKPLLPPCDISLETVAENQIIVARNFWTGTLCKKYVSFLKTLPLTTTPGKPKKGDALRVNDRFQVLDEGFANRLWVETGMRELLCGGEDGEEEGILSKEERRALWGGEPIGLNPSIRIYRYTKGQYFDCHYDESNVLTLNTKPTPTPARTTWTMLLYLTSPATGCEGGQTVFYPDDLPGKKSGLDKEIVVELETGLMLLHKHGNDCMLHEGREVTDGEKWVIRSDLCVERKRANAADLDTLRNGL